MSFFTKKKIYYNKKCEDKKISKRKICKYVQRKKRNKDAMTGRQFIKDI